MAFCEVWSAFYILSSLSNMTYYIQDSHTPLKFKIIAKNYLQLLLIKIRYLHMMVLLTITFQKSCFICFNENPLKIMKNASHLNSKVLFVLKKFKFSSRLFGHEEKRFDRRISLILKFMTS